MTEEGVHGGGARGREGGTGRARRRGWAALRAGSALGRGGGALRGRHSCGEDPELGGQAGPNASHAGGEVREVGV